MECQTLTRAGIGVTVICPTGGAAQERFEVLDGVRIHRYPPPPEARGVVGFGIEFVIAWLWTLRLAVREHREVGFGVIQACNPPDTYWALARLFRPLGVRFVYDQHDLCPELFDARFARPNPLLKRALLWLERRTYATADHVIVTNASFRRIALDRGRLAPDTVTIVRSGPLTDRLRRVPPDPRLRAGSRHLVCYLGVMGPQDGVDLLVRAAGELGRDDVHFAFLGFGDELSSLEELARELGLTDRVTFTGRVGDEAIRRYLSTAAVAVAPDPPNGFNELCTMNKVVEYMACETPVLSFDLEETRVSAGDAARYVDDPSPAALAHALDELLDDAVSRRRMGQAGRERVELALSWDHQAPGYLAVYRGLLGLTDAEPTQVIDLAGTEPDPSPAHDVIELDDVIARSATGARP